MSLINTNYSKQFNDLLNDNSKINSLLEGCHFRNSTFDIWFKQRSFIANAIGQGGTILDIGCANGFLLLCLKEWTKENLILYGIDSDLEHIKDCKVLFPEYKNNFLHLPLNEIYSTGQLIPFGLCHWPLIKHIEIFSNYCFPTNFDYIYWNVWDNWVFDTVDSITPVGWLKQTRLSPNGRLILGFYCKEKSENMKKIDKLQRLGLKFENVFENPYGQSPVVAYLRN